MNEVTVRVTLIEPFFSMIFVSYLSHDCLSGPETQKYRKVYKRNLDLLGDDLDPDMDSGLLTTVR